MQTKTVNPEDYIFLLKSIVSKFINKSQKIEDSEVYSCGCVALMNALTTYDCNKGAFSTWATKIITSSIIDFYRRSKKFKNIVHLGDDTFKISKNYKNRIPDSFLSMLLEENKKDKKADRQNKKILIDYYLNNKSWAEIGRELKLSRERVRQKGQQALVSIRKNYKSVIDEVEGCYFEAN